MRCLLDVNVLIALADGAHANHDAAHAWFAVGRDWATSPTTQNAFVRIVSNRAYPTVDVSPAGAGRFLGQLMAHPRHIALDDDVSLTDASLFDLELIGSSRAVTDVYLVGLAQRHGLRLATFDRRIRHTAVKGAEETVELIPA